MNINPIITYAINLESRKDRLKHITEQFHGRDEFLLNIVPAIKDDIGAYGLYQTVYKIVEMEFSRNSKFFILCEDDHVFTENYSKDFMHSSIINAQNFNADILSGGMSWFDHCLRVNKNLFWINSFNGMQFTVIFKNFYDIFLSSRYDKLSCVDINISNLSSSIFVTYPYISTQKEFGYSDVTINNSTNGYVNSIFSSSINRLHMLSRVYDYYDLTISKDNS